MAGGWNSNGALANAEVYDPTTARFKTVGTMNQVRVRHTATLLNGGDVLIAGGEDSTNNILSVAEIYIPVLGKFSLTGSVNTARDDHAATLLTNGTVLIEGGFAWDPITVTGNSTGMSSTAQVNLVVQSNRRAARRLCVMIALFCFRNKMQ